jgi:hypothetical protein
MLLVFLESTELIKRMLIKEGHTCLSFDTCFRKAATADSCERGASSSSDDISMTSEEGIRRTLLETFFGRGWEGDLV